MPESSGIKEYIDKVIDKIHHSVFKRLSDDRRAVQTRNLRELTETYGDSDCKDIRDRIYGFVGLAADGATVNVDYSISVEELLLERAAFLDSAGIQKLALVLQYDLNMLKMEVFSLPWYHGVLEASQTAGEDDYIHDWRPRHAQAVKFQRIIDKNLEVVVIKSSKTVLLLNSEKCEDLLKAFTLHVRYCLKCRFPRVYLSTDDSSTCTWGLMYSVWIFRRLYKESRVVVRSSREQTLIIGIPEQCDAMRVYMKHPAFDWPFISLRLIDNVMIDCLACFVAFLKCFLNSSIIPYCLAYSVMCLKCLLDSITILYNMAWSVPRLLMPLLMLLPVCLWYLAVGLVLFGFNLVWLMCWPKDTATMMFAWIRTGEAPEFFSWLYNVLQGTDG